MSEPLRKIIGLARGRLKKYLDEANSLLSQPVAEKSLEEDELQIEEVMNRITVSCSLLERCNRDWTDVMKNLKGNER